MSIGSRNFRHSSLRLGSFAQPELTGGDVWAFDVVFGPDDGMLCRTRSSDSLDSLERMLSGRKKDGSALARSNTAAAAGVRASLLGSPRGRGGNFHIPEATLVEVDSSDDEEDEDSGKEGGPGEDLDLGLGLGTADAKGHAGHHAGHGAGRDPNLYYFAGGMRRTASRRAPSMRVGR